jgi:hypothetical protein
MARKKEVTPAVQLAFYQALLVTFYKDNMLPFFLGTFILFEHDTLSVFV